MIVVNSVRTNSQGIQEINGFKVVRKVRWFAKDEDPLIGEAILSDASLTELQVLFHQSADNPMFDCYPISEHQMVYLQQHIEPEMNLTQFDYFLECDAI